MAIEDGRLSRDDLGRIAELKAEALSDDGLLEYFPPADNSPRARRLRQPRAAGSTRAQVGFSAGGRGAEPHAAARRAAGRRAGLRQVAGGQGDRAARWQLPLLKLDAGRALRQVHRRDRAEPAPRRIAIGRAMAPAVLWIDEIEKALSPGGGGDTDGGAVAARVRHLPDLAAGEARRRCSWSPPPTTSRRLPPELLRKGRFDEIFFVDLPDAAERERDLRASTCGCAARTRPRFDLPRAGRGQRGLQRRGDRAGGDRVAARRAARRARARHRGAARRSCAPPCRCRSRAARTSRVCARTRGSASSRCADLSSRAIGWPAPEASGADSSA